jgi:hypothetical protein
MNEMLKMKQMAHTQYQSFILPEVAPLLLAHNLNKME